LSFFEIKIQSINLVTGSSCLKPLNVTEGPKGMVLEISLLSLITFLSAIILSESGSELKSHMKITS